jgi:hypothetical protein
MRHPKGVVPTLSKKGHRAGHIIARSLTMLNNSPGLLSKLDEDKLEGTS